MADKLGKNYASDPKVVERLQEHLGNMVRLARTNRYTKEVQWLEDLRLYRCVEADGNQYYGRSNLVIPELFHQVENSVDKQLSGIFPSNNYMGAIPTKTTTEDEAKDVESAILYELDVHNLIRARYQKHLRQKVLYGTAPVKSVWKKKESTIFTRNKSGKPISKSVDLYNAPHLDVIDTFRWYVYPEIINSIDDASIVFEDSIANMRDLKAADIYVNLDEVKPAPVYSDEHYWVDTQRLSIDLIANTIGERKDTALITELWTMFDIVPGEFTLVKVMIANYDTFIGINFNPYWHQQLPYDVSRYVEVKGAFYGMSLPDRIRSLQYQITDLGNQTMDSLNYSLNPITVIDPAQAGDPTSFKMQPGAKWFGSPDGIKPMQMVDVSQIGFTAMQQVRSMISQFSDSATGIAPQLQGKARSATQAGIVQSEVSSDLKNVVVVEEADVLIQVCKKFQSLITQYREKNYQIRIQGPDKGAWIMKDIDPKTLAAEVDWYWAGSSAEERTAVRSQQLIALFNTAIQASQAIPGQIDLAKLFQMVVKEGFNLRDADQLLVELRDNKTVDPEVENIALKQGQEVPVNAGDIAIVHIPVHMKALQEASSDKEKISLAKHIQAHQRIEEAKQQKQDLQNQVASMQGQAQSMPQPGQVAQQQGSGMVGNKAQAANPSSPQQLMQGVRAVQP